MLNDHGVKKKPITTCNPHANAIVKQGHQTIGNVIPIIQLHGTIWMMMILGKES